MVLLHNISASHIFSTGEILTLELAKTLKGKRIAATSSEHSGNAPIVHVFEIGEITSEWDHAGETSFESHDSHNYPTYQDYWNRTMSSDRILELKNELILFSTEGKRMYKCHSQSREYSVPTFTGSDADREVYFILLD